MSALSTVDVLRRRRDENVSISDIDFADPSCPSCQRLLEKRLGPLPAHINANDSS